MGWRVRLFAVKKKTVGGWLVRQLCVFVGVFLSMAGFSMGQAATPTPTPRQLASRSLYNPARTSMQAIVQTQLFPQLDFLATKLREEKDQLTLDGTAAFKGNDKFLPGKIALGLGHVLLNTPASDPRFTQALADFRASADLS